MRGGFQKTFGAASRVFVPKANLRLQDMIDRFSVKKGKGYSVNKQVPQEVVGQEILVCIGSLEIAMWAKSVDIPMHQQMIDEQAGFRLTPVRLVKALKYLGYSGAELNPKCAATKKALKHDCLKYSHITLEKMLIAIFATRPRYLSIVGKFGARVDINMKDGAYENFWMWKHYTPPEFDIEKHLVRLDLAYNIPLRRKYLMQVTATIDNQITEGVVQSEIFSADAIGAGNARCSRLFYNGHSAARDQRAGGVELKFDKFHRPYSPSRVWKIKIYNTLAHLVRQKNDIVDGNRNIKDQLSNFTVKKMQTGVLNLQETFHKGLEYVNEYSTYLRVESTIVSCYPHPSEDPEPLDPACVNLKYCGEEEWIRNHYWAVQHYNNGNFNLKVESIGTVESMIAPVYRIFTLLQIALRRDQKTFVKDMSPKETNLIYITYLYTLLRTFAGYTGSRHHHAIKAYTGAPYGTYPDFSGTLFLLDLEKKQKKEVGKFIDPIRHTPTLEGEEALRFEQRYFLMSSMSIGEQERAMEFLDHADTLNDIDLAEEMTWFQQKLQTVAEQRQTLLRQALDKKVLNDQKLKDLCGKHYHKIGVSRLMRIFGLSTMDKAAALREGSCVLTYNLIPFRGLDATDVGFLQLVASIGGAPNQSAKTMTSGDLPYLEEEIETLEGLVHQMILRYQDTYEPLPMVSDSEVESNAAATNRELVWDQDHVPTVEEVIQTVKTVKYTEPWCGIVSQKIKRTGLIFKPVKHKNKRMGGVKVQDVNEETSMIEMPSDVAECLNAMYSYIDNKLKVVTLANKMNIFTRDLRNDKTATALDVIDKILTCYRKKYPDIDGGNDGIYFEDPDQIDDPNDEEYENNGYGADGDIPKNELNPSSQDYLDNLEERRASYSVRSSAGNAQAREEWLEVHEENAKLQEVMNHDVD